MGDNLPKLMEDCIEPDYKIKRVDKDYELVENKIPYFFKAPSKESYGFRIEMEKLKLFGGNPPEYVAKMCDALFVIQDGNGKDLVVAVEIKSNKKGQANKQLFNGVAFCQWLIGLLTEYKYYKAKPEYIGLLIMGGNSRQTPKNPIVRPATMEKFSTYKKIKMYKTRGHTIHFNELVKKLA